MEPFIETNAAPLIINEFNPNNISRCLSCNLIPLINITYEKNNPIISYECPNKHNGNKNINEFMKLRKIIQFLMKNVENVIKIKKLKIIFFLIVQNAINSYVKNVLINIETINIC